MGLYLKNEDLVIKGNRGINLPQFPAIDTFPKYSDGIFTALADWTKNVLDVNQVGASALYHRHRPPEQLILPSTVDLPLLVIRSLRSSPRTSGGYEPDRSIEVAPNQLATDFTRLFSSVTTPEGTTSRIGEERDWVDNFRHMRRIDLERDQRLMPVVGDILEQLGYDERAFAGPDVQTYAAYKRQVCEQFDPSRVPSS